MISTDRLPTEHLPDNHLILQEQFCWGIEDSVNVLLNHLVSMHRQIRRNVDTVTLCDQCITAQLWELSFSSSCSALLRKNTPSDFINRIPYKVYSISSLITHEITVLYICTHKRTIVNMVHLNRYYVSRVDVALQFKLSRCNVVFLLDMYACFHYTIYNITEVISGDTHKI